MVAFEDVQPPPADDAALRQQRGNHILHFQPGDQGLAARARLPFLSWHTVGGEETAPYADVFDLCGRYLRITSSVALPRAFYKFQIAAAPLNRCWHLVLPGLGLEPAGGAAVAVTPLTRRAAKRAIKAAVAALTPAQLSELEVDDSEWVERIAPASLTTAPFNTHGSWLLSLTWDKLQAVGNPSPLDAAAEIIYASGDVIGDTAYTAISGAKVAMARIALDTRDTVATVDGEELADEFAELLRDAMPPEPLIAALLQRRRLGALGAHIALRFAVGEARMQQEAALVRRNMDSVLDGGDATKHLVELTSGADADQRERALLGAAAELNIDTQGVLTLTVIERLNRALKEDGPWLSLPDTAALPLSERLPALLDRRRARVIAATVAPGSSGGYYSGTGNGTTAATAASVTHSKPYQEALNAELSTTTFDATWRAAQSRLASGAVGSKLDGVQVALTGTWTEAGPAPAGGGDPPMVTIEKGARGLFHQLVWGKMRGVPQRPELDELVRARSHTPLLLGRAAVEAMLPGRAIPALSALANLALDALDIALRGDGRVRASWSTLNLEAVLLAPLEKAVRPGKSFVIGEFSEAYTDEKRLNTLAKVGAPIMALLGADDGDVDSFAAVCEEAAGFLDLHLGIDAKVDKAARRLTHAYVAGAIAEFGAAYDQVRFGEDARSPLPAVFVQPLSKAAAGWTAGVKLIERRVEDIRVNQLGLSDGSDSADEAAATTSRAAKVKEKPPKGTQDATFAKGVLTVKSSGNAYRMSDAVKAYLDTGCCVKHNFVTALNLSPKCPSACKYKHAMITGFKASEWRTDRTKPSKPDKEQIAGAGALVALAESDAAEGEATAEEASEASKPKGKRAARTGSAKRAKKPKSSQ